MSSFEERSKGKPNKPSISRIENMADQLSDLGPLEKSHLDEEEPLFRKVNCFAKECKGINPDLDIGGRTIPDGSLAWRVICRNGVRIYYHYHCHKGGYSIDNLKLVHITYLGDAWEERYEEGIGP